MKKQNELGVTVESYIQVTQALNLVKFGFLHLIQPNLNEHKITLIETGDKYTLYELNQIFYN